MHLVISCSLASICVVASSVMLIEGSNRVSGMSVPMYSVSGELVVPVSLLPMTLHAVSVNAVMARIAIERVGFLISPL